MRFYEFCADDPNNRKPLISLKHINRLKKMKQARRDELAQRKIVMGLMYGDPDDKQAHATRAEIYGVHRNHETSLMAKGIFGFAVRESEGKL